MDAFKLKSEFSPTGDQPAAIASLCNGLRAGQRMQTLLGVTGSGKTFTMANVIAEMNRPTIILEPNKTLAAQVCSEMREFFPETRSNFSFPTTTTINPKLISREKICISKRTR